MIRRVGRGAVPGAVAVVVFIASYLASSSVSFAPIDRIASVATTACGHASGTTGAAVLIGGSQVMTAAHIVIAASEVTVTIGGVDYRATLTYFDPRTDVALLELADVATGSIGVPPIQFAEAEADTMVVVLSGGPSGVFETRVNRRVEIRIEQVRSTTRTSRLGFEFDRRVALGDSGAGVFDETSLVGMVFGRSSVHADRSFAVRSEEIERVLADAPTPPPVYRCDPSQHRVVPVS